MKISEVSIYLSSQGWVDCNIWSVKLLNMYLMNVFQLFGVEDISRDQKGCCDGFLMFGSHENWFSIHTMIYILFFSTLRWVSTAQKLCPRPFSAMMNAGISRPRPDTWATFTNEQKNNKKRKTWPVFPQITACQLGISHGELPISLSPLISAPGRHPAAVCMFLIQPLKMAMITGCQTLGENIT